MTALRIVCHRVFKTVKTAGHTKVAVGARRARRALAWVCTVTALGGIGAAVIPPLFVLPAATPQHVEHRAIGMAAHLPPGWGEDVAWSGAPPAPHKIPEPSTASLLLAALAGLFRRRRPPQAVVATLIAARTRFIGAPHAGVVNAVRLTAGDTDAAFAALYRAIPWRWRAWNGSWSSKPSMLAHDITAYCAGLPALDRRALSIALFDRALGRRRP